MAKGTGIFQYGYGSSTGTGMDVERAYNGYFFVRGTVFLVNSLLASQDC